MAIYTYHYTYLITNTIEEKHYIGSRSCNCLPTEDLGKKYFSSKSFEQNTGFDFQKDQKENPQNYQYQVLEDWFPTRTDATAEEIFLHAYFDVGRNTRFYNKAKQTTSKFDSTGLVHSLESKIRHSIANSGRVYSEDFRRNKSDKTIYSFVHSEHGTIESTRFDLVKKFDNLSCSGLSDLVLGSIKTYKGWKLLNGEEKIITFDRTEHNFYHPLHGHRYCSRYMLAKEFTEINTSALGQVVKGKFSSHCGWGLDSKCISKSQRLSVALTGKPKSIEHRKSRSNQTKYNFEHSEFGYRFCTKFELRLEFPELTLIDRVAKGKIKNHKGWILVHPL